LAISEATTKIEKLCRQCWIRDKKKKNYEVGFG
jgi:hypothetical protein